jgi:hypothetical protein
VSETTLDRLISKGLVDAYACHKACGEYWTQCECHEVWVERQGGLEALTQAEESDKREYHVEWDEDAVVVCSRCETPVSFDDVSPDYWASCNECDEDLYKFECKLETDS